MRTISSVAFILFLVICLNSHYAIAIESLPLRVMQILPQRNQVTGDDGYPVRIGHEFNPDITSLKNVDVEAIKKWMKDNPMSQEEYLNLAPAKNYVRVLDNMGKPIPDAIVRFYQAYYDVPNEIIFAGRTDKDGKYLLPARHGNVHDGKGIFITKPTKNPFGIINKDGSNGSLFFSITARGYTEYRWLDVTALNAAYMTGKKDEAVYEYKTAIGAEGAPKPPILDGDFFTIDELTLRWHKYPNYWAEYFKLYSRKTTTNEYTTLPQSIDDNPFELIMKTEQNKGIWDKTIKMEDGYFEYYLTSVGDFERESSPSRIFVAPSKRYRGNPTSVTVDDDGNILYATPDEKGHYRTIRIDERKRFSMSFLKNPIFHDTFDIISHKGIYISVSHTQAVFSDATGKGMSQIFFYDKNGQSFFAESKSDLYKPSALYAQDDKVYICDEGNNCVFLFSLNDGTLIKFGETALSSKNIKSPAGIAVSPDGLVVLSDTGNNRIILLNDKGEFLKELGEMKEPRGIYYYGNRFYIADTGNNRIVKTDKELKIVGTIEKNLEEPLNRPMDVWVHHYPNEGIRKEFAVLFIADSGSHQIREELIPENELETRPPAKTKEIIKAVAYGNEFDRDDPDTTLKPLQIVLSGLFEQEFFTKEFTMKLDNVLEGIEIRQKEKPFIVDEYFQAFVDFDVVIPEYAEYEPKPAGVNYALASNGAKAEGFYPKSELAIDGKTAPVLAECARGKSQKFKPDILKITLPKETALNRIDVLLFNDNNSYSDLIVETSADGNTWKLLSPALPPNVIRNIKAVLKKFNPKDTKDDAAHISIEYECGYRGWTSWNAKDSGKTRYIRIIPKYNSGPGFNEINIVEVQAWGE